ncbi:hypothetical protein ACO1GT_05785, partial [Staphylococcus arlettae]
QSTAIIIEKLLGELISKVYLLQIRQEAPGIVPNFVCSFLCTLSTGTALAFSLWQVIFPQELAHSTANITEIGTKQ